ncbi:Abi-alpha family protein [Salinibacter altiplanensis]|uniref:Abi-alpha family protein n=1 Tax=Salinibacter altiplanensis TaxID=1803181 RepID=UPI000C9F9540|nr:Abi-alpha family protein [Salinibacter altiplanensis]
MEGWTNKLIEVGLTSAVETLSSEATKKLGPVLNETWEWLNDWINRATNEQEKRATAALVDTAGMISAAGIRPKAVSLRLLKPWTEGVSVEEREFIRSMWTSFLANAANPRPTRKKGHRSFLEIILQLDVGDVMLLNALYHIDSKGDEATLSYRSDEDIREAFEVIGYSRSLDDEELQFAKVNLSRLGLCVKQMAGTGGGSSLLGSSTTWEAKKGPSRVQVSAFGRAFYEATQPPKNSEG